MKFQLKPKPTAAKMARIEIQLLLSLPIQFAPEQDYGHRVWDECDYIDGRPTHQFRWVWSEPDTPSEMDD